MTWAAILLFFAASFWETKPPADWTDAELLKLFTDSPWATMAQPSAQVDARTAPVQVFFATAGPMVEAEKERERRYLRKRNGPPLPEDPMQIEYGLWLEDNKATQFVLAVRTPRADDFSDAAITRRMEEESTLKVGKKKYKMTGHFPPTERDPYLRLAFPREVRPTDKIMVFELYVPGATPPFRLFEFSVKDMIVNGKLEL
jgi:hypothetical protein